MKSKIIICALALALAASGNAQTKVDIERQGRGVDFLLPPFAKPLRTGDQLPATCEQGELYFLRTAPAGANIHVCHGENVWAPQGSAGQGNVTILNDGVTVGVTPNVNILPGAGLISTMVNTGSQVDIQQGLDTAVVLTKQAHQAGGATYCVSSSVDGLSYECSMSPILVTYTPGMVLHWKPQMQNASGTITLNIDALGAQPIRLADGVALPEAGDFGADSLYALWFDGTAFRVVAEVIPSELQTADEVQSGELVYCESEGTVGNAYQCSLSPALTQYTEGMVLHWRPDVDNSSGPTTLTVDGLAPVSVTLADGAAEPGEAVIVAGEVHQLWYDGNQFRILGKTAERFVQMHEYQSGEPVLCEASITSGGSYNCTTEPPFSAYTRGLLLRWLPSAAPTEGPVTLEVNGLGQADVRLADGASDLEPGDIEAGSMYLLWFDSEQFRILNGPSGKVSQTPRPVCTEQFRGRLWFVAAGTGVKDELAVCAKGADDLSEWRILY